MKKKQKDLLKQLDAVIDRLVTERDKLNDIIEQASLQMENLEQGVGALVDARDILSEYV